MQDARPEALAAPLLHSFRGKRMFSLDAGSLVAGTQYRGAFEERLQVGGPVAVWKDRAADLGPLCDSSAAWGVGRPRGDASSPCVHFRLC